jgi:integrase
MPHLSPPTLTEGEVQAILATTAANPRDHLTYSLALGTGLRLAELVGLNVGDIYAPDGTPRSRARVRPEIAKGGRTGDIFLPDALVPKLRKFWASKRLIESTGGQAQIRLGGPLATRLVHLRVYQSVSRSFSRAAQA